MTYAEQLQDRRWQQKRLLIMQRDGWACRDCRDSDNSHNQLSVHHCRYAKFLWEVEDIFLLTLCDDCHKRRQQYEDAAKLALAILFATSPIGRVEMIADQISAMASKQFMIEVGIVGQGEFLSETRWIQHAREYPAMREHVEAVIGRVIDWEKEKAG